MRGLKDRVIVVAGAATGVGAATAARLAAEGATVVVGDRYANGAETTAARITAQGGRSHAIQYDQRDPKSVRALISQSIDRFGVMHGLYANAVDPQLAYQGCELINMSVDDSMLDADLMGCAVLIGEALPRLIGAGGGAIVCMSSVSAIVGQTSRAPHDSVRAGVEALCRHVATRWGKQGVRCNAIVPDMAMTEIVNKPVPVKDASRVRAELCPPRLKPWTTWPALSVFCFPLMVSAYMVRCGASMGVESLAIEP